MYIQINAAYACDYNSFNANQSHEHRKCDYIPDLKIRLTMLYKKRIYI